jgi:hypothetical protein
VTARDSAANGIVLRGDRATVLSGIEADHNGANGVLVAGPGTDRPIAGIATTANRMYVGPFPMAEKYTQWKHAWGPTSLEKGKRV